MMDPKAIQQLFSMLQQQSPAEQADFQRRSKAGTLTFRASIKALKSGCDCEPCQILREYVDVLMAEPDTEVTSDGYDPHPAPRKAANLPRSRQG